MNFCRIFFFSALFFSSQSCAQSAKQNNVSPPQPYGALPSARQLAWHEMEMYNMIEFGTIQYLEEKDWGWGNEDPKIVDPKKFNPEEIVLRAKEAGFKGFLVQAKHHGGFCMWPTKTTDYNITQASWLGGKGDWIGMWQAACAKHGLKFGVYCSPWDRNTAKFGTPEYLEMFKKQLTELMTNYGELFTMWFDGAPGEGGDGYYGGANEYRGGFLNYYDWDSIYALVRRLQPNAVIFGDPGPDIRWVGNEQGYAGETHWATLFEPETKWDGRPSFAGDKFFILRNQGVRNGQYWIPAECDFSLRRRFTYHASDNNTVKTPQKLFDIYVNSVGRGACMDLNLPINRDGEQDEADKKALKEFGEYLRKTFDINLARGAIISASNVRGKDLMQFGTKNLLDDDRYSYWATDDKVISPELSIELTGTMTFNIIKLRENIKLGQRIDSIRVDAWINGSWKEIARATSIGACRIIRLKNYIQSNKIRIKLFSPVCVAISEFSLYAEPEGAEAPIIRRTKEGVVSISSIRPVAIIRYTLDGSEPTTSSRVYTGPFQHDNQGEVRTAAFNINGKRGEMAAKTYDIGKSKWIIVGTSTENKNNSAARSIDDNEGSIWETGHRNNNSDLQGPPQWIAIDMGETATIKAFTYTPRQDGSSNGVVDKYEFQVSNDGQSWIKVAEGDFPNMRNSPVQRIVPLNKPETFRYFKFIARQVLDGKSITAAEFGVRK